MPTMMKKLSATLRRKTSASSSVSRASSDRDRTPGAGLSELTNAYQRVLQEQNRQVDELRRLRALTEAKPPPPPSAPAAKARARTFSAGTPTGAENEPENLPAGAAADVPFFSADAGAAAAPGVLPVRGRPAWQRGRSQKRKASRAKPPRPEKPSAGGPSRRMLTAPSLEPAYAQLDFEPGRTRQLSFSLEGSSRSEGSADASPPSRAERVAGGRRWKLPRRMSADAPAAFTALPGRAEALITNRRDRVEALPLAAACTYLEAELFRIDAQLAAAAPDAQCCCRAHKAPLCECAHRLFLAQSADRLRAVLGVLEDRFDSIEQYYVKGKEYARAMGKFYQVSPSEYSRWVEQRKPTARARSSGR